MVCAACGAGLAGLRIIRIYGGLHVRYVKAKAVEVPAGARTLPAVYVCLCNALTDRQVKQAAASAGSTNPGKVYAACGCRAQCGQCVRALVELLRGESLATPGLQGAD